MMKTALIMLMLVTSLLYGQVVDIVPSEKIVVAPTLQDPIQFTCTSESPIDSVQWRRNGVLLDDMEVGVNITFDPYFNLAILILDDLPEDYTIFQCVVRFESGESITSVEVPLCVQDVMLNSTPADLYTMYLPMSPTGNDSNGATPLEATPSDATLSEVTLSEVTLSEVTPSDATLSEVTLSEVTLSEVTPSEGTPEGTAIRLLISLLFGVVLLVIIVIVLVIIAASIYRWKHGSCCKYSSGIQSQVEDSSSTDSLRVAVESHLSFTES